MRLLWTHVWGMSSYHISSHPRYSLGGTPLGEAVICTPEIVKSFRKTEGIDKVNVIILSDGESNPLSYVRECSYENYRWREDPEKLKDEGPWYRQDYLCHQYHKIFILRDPETRQTVRLNQRHRTQLRRSYPSIRSPTITGSFVLETKVISLHPIRSLTTTASAV